MAMTTPQLLASLLASAQRTEQIDLATALRIVRQVIERVSKGPRL